MTLIPLTQGEYALVDDSDYEELSKYKWYALNMRGSFYAVRHSSAKNGNISYLISMHRQILGLGFRDKRQGDHKNHNTLDNRRTNIRICTSKQNQGNRKNQRNTSSEYKGVYWNKNAKKWHASLLVNGISKHLGYFISEVEAALEYDMAATREHGEFACLNFSDKKPPQGEIPQQ